MKWITKIAYNIMKRMGIGVITWWMENEQFTCWVRTDYYGNIIDTAPLLKGWIGQTIEKAADYYEAEFHRID
jgi:hypothetical protein